MSCVYQNPREKSVLIADDLALQAFDAGSTRLGAVRRRGGGCPTGGGSLPGARTGRRLGFNRRPFGGCRFIGAPPPPASPAYGRPFGWTGARNPLRVDSLLRNTELRQRGRRQ